MKRSSYVLFVRYYSREDFRVTVSRVIFRDNPGVLQGRPWRFSKMSLDVFKDNPGRSRSPEKRHAAPSKAVQDLLEGTCAPPSGPLKTSSRVLRGVITAVKDLSRGLAHLHPSCPGPPQGCPRGLIRVAQDLLRGATRLHLGHPRLL